MFWLPKEKAGEGLGERSLPNNAVYDLLGVLILIILDISNLSRYLKKRDKLLSLSIF